MTTSSTTVHLLAFSGDAEEAQQTVERLYPGHPVLLLPRKDLREQGWKGQVRMFRRLSGRALVFYAESLHELYQERLMACTAFLHHCSETAFADSAGAFRRYPRKNRLRLMPALAVSILSDTFVLAASWVMLHVLLRNARPADFSGGERTLDIAYLYPYPLNRYTVGGAMSHVRGVLGGLRECSARVRVFYGGSCPVDTQTATEIPSARRWFLFWEALMLSYNLRFARQVRRALRHEKVGAIYQRHGRFVIAGALLSRWLKVPLILEYNGSEQWMARHWDPSRFQSWLRLCEQYVLRASNFVVVVSEPLKRELMDAGVPQERILVNPNGVDPQQFHPDCGGAAVREKLGFHRDEVVVGFLSTYSYFHGVNVLQEAIREIFDGTAAASAPRLRFLLLGQGALWQETRQTLQDLAARGTVVFTGAVPHREVPAFLDATDILVSPHVPMPDGRPFFGSPTKLFEYMATGKAIVASNLDQLARVLTHDQTAWLVTPGSPRELADAVRLLAGNAEKRARLGRAAREAALARHTWRHNAGRVLGLFVTDSALQPEPAGAR